MARIANARFEIIPRSGHLIPTDQPEDLAKHIENFVLSLSK